MAKKTSSPKHMSNADLAEAFEEELESGSPVIIHIEDSKNPDYLAMFIAQQKSAADEVAAFFLGFKGLIIRAVQTVSKAEIKNNKALAKMVKEGNLLTDFDIHIEDSTSPFFKDQQPKKRVSDGEVLIQHTKEGDPIYRNVSLVPVGSKDDSIMTSNNWIPEEDAGVFNALSGPAVEATE